MSRIVILVLLCFGLSGELLAYTLKPGSGIFLKEKSELLGDEACRVKDWENARIQYKKALISDSANSFLHYKYGAVLAMIVTKDKWRGLSLLSEMRGSFETAIKLDPAQIEAHWGLVEYYLQVPGILGGSESKAKSFADQLSKISAVDGLLAKARIAAYFDRNKQAEGLYLKAISNFQSETARQKLIELYTKNKEPVKAEKLSKQPSKTTNN